MDEDYFVKKVFPLVTGLTGFLTALAGILAMLVWQFGIAFLFTGVALILLRYKHRAAVFMVRLFSGIAISTGAVILLGIIAPSIFSIDEVLSRSNIFPGSASGQDGMALNTAISQVLTATAILLLSFRRSRFIYFLEFCLVLTFSINVAGLFVINSGLTGFSEATGYARMTFFEAASYVIISTGLFAAFILRFTFRVSIGQKLFAVLLIMAFAFVFITLLSNSGFKSIRDEGDRIENTMNVKYHLNLLLTDVVDIETGMRGYLISGNEEYLEPMILANDNLNGSIHELSVLLQDNELQLARLDTLERIIGERVEHAELIRQKIITEGLAAGLELFDTGIGKKLTDKIRNLLVEMKDEENRLLMIRNLKEIQGLKKARRIIFLNLFVQLALLTIVFVVVRRTINQKIHAMQEVRLLNEELENRVAERTASLAKGEERFRTTLDNMMEGCQIIDFSYSYLFLNQSAVMQGRKPVGELLGRQMREVYPGIEKTAMFSLLQQTMEKRIPNHTENKFEYPDGTVKWFDLSMQPVPEGVFVLSIDITERKNSEKALLESEEKFRSIMENSADAIFITNQLGRYTYANKAVTNLLGFSPGEILTMSIADVAPPDKIEEHTRMFGLLLNEGKIYTELDLVKKDGVIITTDLNAVLLPGGMVYGSSRDITARKLEQSELIRHRDHLEELVNERTEELRASLAETIDLYENAPCGYHSLDSRGIFVRINQTELKWLGYTASEIVGNKKIIEFLTPEGARKFNTSFPLFLEKGEISNLELELVRKDGSTFTVSVNATAVYDSQGNFVMSRSTLFDITGRKQIEEALNKAKIYADEANRSKSEFLANMSHEIRTPLNAVLGYTDLLANMQEDPTQLEYINSIKASGKSLLTLINDILDLSKIEAGKLDLEFDYVDTALFFSEFERIFSLKIAEKGLSFHLNIASGTPAGLYIDEARVRQIVFNLIGNAIKFTSTGSVTLKVIAENPQQVKYPDGRTEEYIDLIIEVRDTGIGIPKKMQESIFDPFVQDRESKHHGGTGLGLAISRRLAALMDGTVQVASRPGKGSSFRVVIPRILFVRDFTKTTVDIQIDPSEIYFDKATILVVDDVEYNRKYLKDALKNTELSLIDARDGLSALALARQTLPDLIIADIRMPNMDGFQLLKKLKADSKLKHIPVIAYSASALKNKKDKINKSDFVGLLIKPVRITELYLVLMNILSYKSAKQVLPDKFRDDHGVEINDPAGLVLSLETDFFNTWKSFAVRQPIGEIRDFGRQLIELGETHHSSLVTGFGTDLVKAANSFNIKLILKLINSFPVIIKSLKNPVNTSNHE